MDSIALAAVLELDPTNRGLNPGHPSLNLRYNYGFWAQVYSGASHGCAPGVEREHYYQPYLSGYGGIRMVLLSNGAVYYYVSDNGQASMRAEVQEASRIIIDEKNKNTSVNQTASNRPGPPAGRRTSAP